MKRRDRTSGRSEMRGPGLPLPSDTAERLSQNPTLKKDNLGLWLDRFLSRSQPRWDFKGKHRQDRLLEFCGAWTGDAGREALERRVDGCRLMNLESSPSPGNNAPLLLRFERSLAGRLLVDAGRASAAEISLSFHPIWGTPRIPGSALKGLARSQADLEGWPVDKLRVVFGAQARGGRVAFLDALPQDGCFVLETDVLTPHFAPWYNKEADAPYEWFNPVPIHLLTIVRTRFVFDLMWLGPQQAAVQTSFGPDALLQETGALLARALFEQGVGGKTAAGYGIFEED